MEVSITIVTKLLVDDFQIILETRVSRLTKGSKFELQISYSHFTIVFYMNVSLDI